MPVRSAGLLCFRPGANGPEVLLVHPGGPFWARRDDGVWSVPKGEVEPGEEPEAVAAREFAEELGQAPPDGRWLDLGHVVQRGGKRVDVWAVAGDLDETTGHSNLFEMEWPPHSGRRQWFPEVDRAAWFAVPEARVKVLAAQEPLLDRLVARLAGGGATGAG